MAICPSVYVMAYTGHVESFASCIELHQESSIDVETLCPIQEQVILSENKLQHTVMEGGGGTPT